MAASTSPVFIATPKTWVKRCSTVNTVRDGTGTITTVVTPGADGSLVEGIEVQAEATTASDCLVNLFLSDDAGVTWYFWRAMLLATTTAAVGTDTANNKLATDYLPLPLASTHRLGAACTLAGNYTVIARGGNY